MGEVFKAIRERVDDIENDLNRFLEEGETDHLVHSENWHNVAWHPQYYRV